MFDIFIKKILIEATFCALFSLINKIMQFIGDFFLFIEFVLV